jgi:lipase chaperone LimK
MAKGKREYRPWTDEDQQQAERLYAAGVNLHTIGRTLDRDPSLVKYHLDPRMAEKKRETTLAYHAKNPEWHSQYQKDNPDKVRIFTARWAEKNPEKVRERRIRSWGTRRARLENDPDYRQAYRQARHEYYLAHKAEILANNRLWQKKNRERVLEYARRYREKKKSRQEDGA